MNLPGSIVSGGKAAVQALWSDTATIIRNVDVGQTTEEQTAYADIPCHLSQTSMPTLSTDNAAAMAEPVFTLYVDTSVVLKLGDSITVKHKGQTFSGLAGLPFNRTFSNCTKLSGVEIS